MIEPTLRPSRRRRGVSPFQWWMILLAVVAVVGLGLFVLGLLHTPGMLLNTWRPVNIL